MLPRYTLPVREPAGNINLETKPKQVDAWLSRLPLSDPAEAAEEMADYLATLNPADVAYDNRCKIIERLGPVVEDIVASLYEQYGSVSLPLPPKQQRHAQLAKRLLMEMSSAYKILLLDWLKRRFHLFGGNPVPLYLQRILLSLQAVLEISFETHEPVPEGVWVDLHQTYNYALRNGMKDAIPEGGGKSLTLEHIYKATLLIALADPYHFPPVELPWAKDIIARFSNLVSIFPAEETTKGQAGLFMVEINTDSPPKPISREGHPMNPRWDLLLNTTELAKHLALISTHLKDPEDRDRLGLPDAAQDPAYRSMLRRLKLNWGASLQRQSQRRRHQDGKEVEVCFGLKAVHQLISPSSNKGETIHYGLAGNEPPPVVVRCKTVNDSMGGLALERNSTGGVQVRVGDVAGVRQSNGNWGVGLVRWFRVPKPGEIFFGVQLLSPKAQAIHLRRKDNGRQWPGLLLQSNPVTKQAPLLLALPGCFVPNQAADIRTPQGNQSIQIDKLLESTSSTELFRFLDEGAGSA